MNHKQGLVELIRSHAARAGSATAVEHGGDRVGYGELVARIERRAADLDGLGASGALVAVERRKSPAFLVDYLSVFAVGGTVVPIDPDVPAERRATFLDLVRPQLLVGDDGVVRLGGRPPAGLPEDGAFVYFTSGSTGLPKPVLGSAAALRSFLDWFRPEFGVGAHDRFAFTTGLSFEASLRDIFPPLAAGATLVVPDDDVLDEPDATVAWLAASRISVVTVVPSVARAWLRNARTTCPSVRAVFFVGEPSATDVLAGWRTVFPGTTVLVNSYGSTESGQATVYKRVDDGAVRSGRVPAGRPVPGTRYCFVDPGATLDADLVRDRLERPAQSGEIVIVSRACSHGYLGLPAEQASRFAHLGDGVTAYRTGDLGRVDDAGELVVIGRADDEVKINGVRVHPAEVTRAIRAHASVADGFVIATRTDDGAGGDDARLTAYVVPADAAGLPVVELRRDLMDALPLAMIPARFVEVDALPTTRTGKVDRGALVALAERPRPVRPFVAPSGELECWVADTFCELFALDRVSAADDLFSLGGDSITAVRLASRATRDLGVDLSLRAIFAAATVAGIAAAVVEQQLLEADPDDLAALLDALDGETV